MDTLKIRLDSSQRGLIRAKAGFASFMMLAGLVTTVNADELSLENRLKEFNQPTVIASVSKEASSKPAVVKTAVKKKTVKSSRLKRACYQSSASAIRKTAQSFQPYISANSRRYSVDEALIISVITAESCFRQTARSHKGAQGLMQLMPPTADRFGVTDAFDPRDNIKGGTAYLDWLLTEFDNGVIFALAGYNAGEGAVRNNNGVPPYAETRAYVPKVLAAWEVARGLCITPPELVTDGCVFNVNRE